MLQIYVYDDTGASFELDLYKEEPFKLTLSAEEITDIPRVNSAFSRAFRIPATQNNSKVFQWWYEVNTVDFDITRRVRADVYSDGLFYKSGHIRIQNAYVNQETTQVDLEVVFFGETRDFASQIGEVTLDKLDLTQYNHDLTLANVEASWDGNLPGFRYIVANRGYDYDDNGTVVAGQAEIADDQQHTNSFQKSNHPLFINQFTPMIQVKAIIDAIFEQTEYTYSSDSFFNDTLFENLYTEGLPRAEALINSVDGTFEARGTGQNLSPFGSVDYVEFPNEISDPSKSYNPAISIFYVPIAGTYTINAKFDLEIGRNVSNPTPSYTINLVQGGTILQQITGTAPFGVFKYDLPVDLSFTGSLIQSTNPGETVNVQVSFTNTNGNNYVKPYDDTVTPERGVFECTQAAQDFISANELLKFDVKSIDFLKSIITKFKLIMVPNPQNEFEFIVKPWKDYMASGERFDWTEKLDTSKDITLKPIFFEQSQIINFEDVQDEDERNKPFQEQNGRTYGALQFDSNNDLLSGARKVSTVFAPTPVDVPPGFDATSDFVIPYFSKEGSEESDHGHLQELPLRVKPRLLFWNGNVTIPASEYWWYGDGVPANKTQATTQPLMTPYSVFPTDATTINLNWFRDEPYFTDPNDGKSVYEEYWNQYVQELYSPLSRILTAYFNLDSNDLRTLSFDDIIFIQNAYYRVLKVYDAPITDVQTVKVDLVKILETLTFANNGTPTGDGGGIDDVIVTGGGGSPVEPPGDDTWGGNDTNFGDDDNTWGGTTYYYHTVQACTNPGDTFTTRHDSLVAIGDSVKMSGVIHVDVCYEVIAHTTGPEDTVVLETFPDCFSCDQ